MVSFERPLRAIGRANWLAFAYAAFAFYLLSPLGIVLAMSLKDAPFMGFPITDWTFDWYVEAMQDREFLSALLLSFWIAIVSTLIALVVGIWAATALNSPYMPFKGIVFALICLPIVVPSIVQAISLRIFTRSIGIDQGTTAIILAHAVHAVPFVVLMVLTRLRAMPVNLTDAARDLGADGFTAFVRVTVPFLMPALIGGSIFALLTSFDDFVRSTFLGSFEPTLPVLLYNRLHSGISPSIAAISSIVLILTVLLGLYAERTVRKMR